MKNQTYVLLAIFFIVVISIFSVLNVEPVEVNFLVWQGESPLIFIILFSVLLGSLVTIIFGIGKYVSLSREKKRLQQRALYLEKTIKQQTNLSLEKEEAKNNGHIDKKEDQPID